MSLKFPGLVEEYSQEWCMTVVCAEPDEHCYFGECENCAATKKFLNLPLPDEKRMEEVALSLWEKRKNDLLNREQFVKTKIVLPLETVYANFCEELPKFLRHHYIKRKQMEHYSLMKTVASPTVVVMQV
jgi:hypothetical protein